MMAQSKSPPKEAPLEALTESEAYLWSIFQDSVDLAEFSWYDHTRPDNFFRAYDFQFAWWRHPDHYTIDFSARSVGKTLGIELRMFQFPFALPGRDAVVTAPTQAQVDFVIQKIEFRFYSQRLGREMILKPPVHRPFIFQMKNGSKIMGIIPRGDGSGLRGIHPTMLDMDECFVAGTLVMTKRGQIPIEEVVVGDQVLTHKRRWRPVTAIAQRERETVIVRGQGHPGMEVSVNQKFWGARSLQNWRDKSHFTDQTMYSITNSRLEFINNVVQPNQWIPASEMQDNYWCSPTTFPRVHWIPSSREKGENGGKNEFPCDRSSLDFLWVMGLWIAEGSIGGDRVYFSVHKKEAEYVKERLERVGLKASIYFLKNNDGANVVVGSRVLAEWLPEHCGKGAKNKEVPIWVFGLPTAERRAVFDGLHYGDGCTVVEPYVTKEDTWKLSTASWKLAVSDRLLGLSLGYAIGLYKIEGRKNPSVIRGREIKSGIWYQVVGRLPGEQGFDFDLARYAAVKDVIPTGQVKTLFDLTVKDDHSYLADGIYSSNSQDMPEAAWSEATETVKRGEKDGAWRCHGVTTGVGNEFYRNSKHAEGEPELRPVSHDAEGLFTIHHIPAMADPNFTPQERQRKMNTYPDESEWRRNVRGLPGDAMSPLFRGAAVTRCVEDDLSADYNKEIYWHKTISNYDLNATQTDITTLLAKPSEHMDPRFTTIWAGMDIGLSNDPTEILLFAEYHPAGDEKKVLINRSKAYPKNDQSRLMLIARITLNKVHAPAQGDLIMWLCENYDIQRFTMDSTGIGLPMFQYIQREQAEGTYAARRALAAIVGYNFSQKILVAFDDRIEIDSRLIDDKVKEQGIMREVKSWGTDMIRLYLEEQRLWLPWDIEFIRQLQASKFIFKRGAFDDYGRRVQMFTTGDDHCLDALRMAVLGHAQLTIDTMVSAHDQPVIEQIVTEDDFSSFRGYDTPSQDYDPYGWS